MGAAALRTLADLAEKILEPVKNRLQKDGHFVTVYTSAGLYTELPVTQDMIDAIMEIKGIEKYDASARTLVSTNLMIVPGNVPLKSDVNNKVYARTVAGTENNSFFQSGIMKLTGGKHITGNESNAAVIRKIWRIRTT